MPAILSIRNLTKTYAGGHQALNAVTLDIARGEIFALLGPNGAGKTTLIGISCGLVTPSSGSVTVDGHDVVRDFRAARASIGLVPQELTTDAFETVWATVSFSRGLFGRRPDAALLEQVLRSLSLWEKKDSKIATLSGGMKRRVLIAKALAHEPRVLFLDEPSAGVDVELRRDMWNVVRRLRDAGVTIILTTHYIEEAEEMADRIGIISRGELILVEGQGDADAETRPQAAHPASAECPRGHPAQPQRLRPHVEPRWSDPRLCLRERRRAGPDHRAAAPAERRGRELPGSGDQPELARGNLRVAGPGCRMNWQAVRAIYRFEMSRTFRTLVQSIGAPVLSTSLYFVVFGSAIGSRMTQIGGVPYGAFIVPGLIMLSVLTESVGNGSFGIYMPKWAGTLYELLSAPVSTPEILLGYVGAAACKSILVGLIILATSTLFVPLHILHPLGMIVFLVLTSVSFSLFGFMLGVWADSWEKLQVVPLLVITPLTFLGGSFYSIDMLPPFWRGVTLFNPVVYLISGFRWSFYGLSDVGIGVSLGFITVFLAACLGIVSWMIRTGWRLKN